jgi:hypothetical protein
VIASLSWMSSRSASDRSSRPLGTRSKPPGFILPCQPALADKPPAGPGWLHETED